MGVVFFDCAKTKKGNAQIAIMLKNAINLKYVICWFYKVDSSF
jgi:hypothetical protein